MAERLVVDGVMASFADLARAAGVSVPTLRHYFGDREGAVVATFQAMDVSSRDLLEALSDPGPHALRESLQHWATRTVDGFRHYGVGNLFAGALSHGLHDPVIGPAFVKYVLEPSIALCERLLQRHRERGEIDIPDDELRGAALSLLSPLVLALLHQDALHGKTERPLDVRAFAARHVDRFLNGYGPAI
ncbi:MAG: TetR/AcrR family transcriptional regulator C-terminal ligand-binding domain-containing protein [Myxococcota bacterium]